jgi:hypothetical protein
MAEREDLHLARIVFNHRAAVGLQNTRESGRVEASGRNPAGELVIPDTVVSP